MIREWNSLSEEKRNASSVNAFGLHLDQNIIVLEILLNWRQSSADVAYNLRTNCSFLSQDLIHKNISDTSPAHLWQYGNRWSLSASMSPLLWAKTRNFADNFNWPKHNCSMNTKKLLYWRQTSAVVAYETTGHFLLACPLYYGQRQEFLRTVPLISLISVYVLLLGSRTVSYENNAHYRGSL